MAKDTKPRSLSQITRDRLEIARLYLKGVIQADIADRLGMNQSTVSRDLSAIRSEWLKSSLVAFDQRIAFELAKIDNIEIEYWQAWERSKEVKESSTAKITQKPVVLRSKDAKGNLVTQTQTLEGNEATSSQEQMLGNPAYLQGVQWCIDRRLKLFGLDAPIKIDWRQTLPEGLDSDEVQNQFLGILAMAAGITDANTTD